MTLDLEDANQCRQAGLSKPRSVDPRTVSPNKLIHRVRLKILKIVLFGLPRPREQNSRMYDFEPQGGF